MQLIQTTARSHLLPVGRIVYEVVKVDTTHYFLREWKIGNTEAERTVAITAFESEHPIRDLIKKYLK